MSRNPGTGPSAGADRRADTGAAGPERKSQLQIVNYCAISLGVVVR